MQTDLIGDVEAHEGVDGGMEAGVDGPSPCEAPEVIVPEANASGDGAEANASDGEGQGAPIEGEPVASAAEAPEGAGSADEDCGATSQRAAADTAKGVELRAEAAKAPALGDLVKGGNVYSLTTSKGSALVVANASQGAIIQASTDELGGYWQLKKLSGDLYQIVSVLDGKLLSYDANPTSSSFAGLKGKESQWRLKTTSEGAILIMPVSTTDLFLTVLGTKLEKGARLGFAKTTDNLLSRFFFSLSAPLTEALSSGKSITDGAYEIATSLGGSQVLDVRGGSTNDGASIITYRSYQGMSYNQRFIVESVGNRLYTISPVSSGKRVGVRNGAVAAGSTVSQQTASTSLSQLWYLVAQGNGYAIRNAKSGLSLEVQGGKAANSSLLQVAKSASSTAQRFSLTRDAALTESEQSGKLVVAGFYLIGSLLNTSYVIDIRRSGLDNGAAAICYTSSKSQNQKFSLAYIGHGFYTIRATHSGKYLESSGASAGATMRQTGSTGTRAQLWYFVKCGSGYALRSGASGLGLELQGKSSTALALKGSSTASGQQFKLIATQLLTDGSYTFGTQKAMGGWLVLETRGASKAGAANVSMWRTNSSNHQKWKVTHLGNGFYRIANVNSGLVLAVADASLSSGANVRQEKLHNGPSQQWVLDVANGGGFTFKNKKSGKYLDLSGGRVANGANVQQYNGNGTQAQAWVIRTGKGSLQVFAERMVYYTEKANVGYDQSNRWDIRDGGECDCSSLVVHCLQEAGFDTGQATLTFNYREELCPRGWKVLKADLSQAKVGDILLNDDYHTCAVVSGSGLNATIAQASIDENGWIVGGKAGDQTGRETWTRSIYTYRYGWDCILRYCG